MVESGPPPVYTSDDPTVCAGVHTGSNGHTTITIGRHAPPGAVARELARHLTYTQVRAVLAALEQ